MKIARLVAFSATLLALWTTGAAATTYRIGPALGPTRDQITDVANLVNPGDIVEVEGSAAGAPPNLYNTVKFTRDGTAGSPITIVGVVPPGGRRPVVQGGNFTFHVRASHYVVDNLEVTGSTTGQGTSRCVYAEGFNITLKRLLVRDCINHGILVADYETGNVVIDQVEVTRVATAAGGSDQYHAIYVSSDITKYPTAAVWIMNSYIHGSASGNGIKSRAGRTNVYNNWVEIAGNFYPVQINGSEEHDCIIPRGDGTNRGCDADIVGNVFIAYGFNMFNVGDGTGENRGRIRVVNNTFMGGASLDDNFIRIRGPIDSLEMHNNILYMQRAKDVNTFVRDIEAEWLRGSRTIVGSNNLVTLTKNFPAWQLTGTLYKDPDPTKTSIFKNVSFANESALMDVRLKADSVARNLGNSAGTNLAGFEISSPSGPFAEPPRMKPLLDQFVAWLRPAATNADGTPATGKVSAGAFEFPKPVTVTVSENGFGSGTITGPGINCGTDCTESVAAGTPVTLTAVPDAGQHFWRWTAAAGTVCEQGFFSPVCTFTATTNAQGHSLSAYFDPPKAARADLDGNQRSEIVWYNATNGLVYDLQVNGLAVTGGAGAYLNNNANYAPVALADLDGDGNTDMVWRDAATGAVNGMYFRYGSGPSFREKSIAVEPDPAWKIEQVADLHGDRRPSVIWKNQATGAVRATKPGYFAGDPSVSQIVYTEPNLDWKIVASGDMNGDGKADILWRNAATGDVFAMLMDGNTVLSGGVIYSEPNTNWIIVGLADFNGDGKADVLWRNTATGDVFQMQMNGTAVAAGQVIYSEPNAQWTIVALGDYNGDGRADILWRNTASGQVYMMLMNGFAATAADFVYAEPDQAWKILGP